MDSDPLTSAYATLGLIEAKHAGFVVDNAMLFKALAYVQAQFGLTLGSGASQPNRKAFYLYVLARNGAGDYAQFQTLFNVRAGLSLAARSYLLMAFHER